jgi:hypothetical protein
MSCSAEGKEGRIGIYCFRPVSGNVCLPLQYVRKVQTRLNPTIGVHSETIYFQFSQPISVSSSLMPFSRLSLEFPDINTVCIICF